MTTTMIRRCAAIALLTVGICSAQKVVAEPNGDTPPRRFFHLDVVVKEVEEGRAVNSRSYSTTLSGDPGAQRPSIRTGSKVPVSQGSNQFTYIDLGVSFDFRFLTETRSTLALEVSADVSSVATSPGENPPPNAGPVIRQNRWASPVIVVLGKPTTIFSSDDLTSKRKMQIELTATPIQP